MSDYELAQLNIAVMRRRKEWFDNMPEAYVVLWWVRIGHRPSAAEAEMKLKLLRVNGPFEEAFTFRQAFAPPDAANQTLQNS